MMMPEIKICGIKNEKEIEIINKYSVRYIGFIFADSKRQVTENQAIELRKQVRQDIDVVGVFVDEDIEYVNKVVDSCNLDVVQLHGMENNEYCKKVRCKVWKSIGVKGEDSLEIINSYKEVDGILLDTYHNGKSGGTGRIFNWDIARKISRDKRIILGGGLTPDNIIKAIDIVKPHVIDINSGVETNLIKDETKIKQVFMKLDKM